MNNVNTENNTKFTIITALIILFITCGVQIDVQQRASALFKEVKCLICEGESIAYSRTEFANKMRTLIIHEMNSGKSDKEIKHYLSAIYGDEILFYPVFNNNTFFLWLAPFILLFLGLLIIFRIIIFANLNKRQDGVNSE